MWLLQDSDGKIIYLKLGKEIIVGRKKCDIILDNDESISRNHAAFTIRPKETVAPNELISECIIREKGSKYGTYVISEHSKVKVTTEDYFLKDKDTIKFGLQKHIFTVKYVPMITVTSAMQKGHKERLNQIVDEIDGMILSQWVDDCTHLTVSEGTLTKKVYYANRYQELVVFALASAKPIVTVEYWEAVKRAVDNNESLPKPSKFTVPPGELLNRSKVSFVPNENRKLLFSGKTFIHFTKSQFEEYQKIIKYAGGTSVIYKANVLPIKKLCAENIIVLQFPVSDVTQSTMDVVPEYQQICETFEEKKIRMIPDNEIALAILHCSAEKFCNPSFHFSNFLKRTDQTEVRKSSTLVIDTQDLTASEQSIAKRLKKTNSKHYIPETVDEFSQPRNQKTITNSSQNSLVSKKHYIPDSDDFSLQEKASKVHFDTPQAGSEKQKCGSSQTRAKIIPETLDFSLQEKVSKVHFDTLQASSEKQKCRSSQKSAKIIPETMDFSTESSAEVKQELFNDAPNIVRNIFSQSTVSENSSQILLPNPVNPLIEGKNIHKIKALKATNESQTSRKQPECLKLSNAGKPSSEKSGHVTHNTYEIVILRDGKRVSEKPYEVIPDSQKVKTLVSQLSGQNIEKTKPEVNIAMKKKSKIVMISDDEDFKATPATEKEVLEKFEPTSKRRKKQRDTHAHIHNQTITEVPLRKTSVNHNKVFKKSHVNLPRRRIAFQELEVYNRAKDIC